MTKPLLPYQQNKPAAVTRKQAKDSRTRATRRMAKALLDPSSPLHTREHVDPDTGEAYPTKRMLVSAQRNRRAQILRDFARLVADKTLGQDPWEQLPGETDLMYSRFRAFLTLPKTRMKRLLKPVAESLKVNYGVIQDQSARFHWTLRAECWDRHEQAIDDEEFRAERRLSIRRQARLGAKLQELAEKGANNYIRQNALDLTPNDVARLADIGVKTERLAFGDSTSNEAHKAETRVIWDGPVPGWANSSPVLAPETAGQLSSGEDE